MKRMVSKREVLKEVVYKTSNIVMQKIQEDKKSKKCLLIGNGHSLSVDENDKVKLHDPGMIHFESCIKKDCTIYAFYFTFESAGLDESSRDIAKFVDNLPECYEEIVLIGHSKCGLCLTNTSYFTKKEVTLVTISSPFKGTIIADRDAFQKELKYWLFIKIYNMLFSDHNVDKDIAPNSKFISDKLQRPKCKSHINIVSSINKIRDCKETIDFLLLILDKYKKIKGDGVVPYISQQVENCETIKVVSSHATSLDKGLKLVNNCVL